MSGYEGFAGCMALLKSTYNYMAPAHLASKLSSYVVYKSAA